MRQSIEMHTVFLDRVRWRPRIRIMTKKLKIEHETGTPIESHPRVKRLLSIGYQVSMFWYDYPQTKGNR